MGKKLDLLGDETYSTSQFADPEDLLTDDGLAAVITPRDADLATDSEDDDAWEGLRADLSPGESQEVLDTMRPLSKEEADILDDSPDVSDLHKVDDPAQESFLLDRTKEGYRAMDTVLDDAIYGDAHMDNDERNERVGRDTDVGFGIPGLSSLKKVAKGAYKYGKKGVTAPLSLAKTAAKKFVPSRDAGKAKIVRNLYNRLVTEHANYLGVQDQQAGKPVQSPSYYQSISKPWAKQQIARGGLPTSLVVSGADVLGADLCGSDVCGSWWNPMSWFGAQSQTVMVNTQGQRSAVGPDGQPVDPSATDPSATDPSLADPSAAAPASDPSAYQNPGTYQDPGAYQDPSAYAQGDVSCGVAGDDSLGAAIEEIVSGVAPAPRSRPSQSTDDRFVLSIVSSLKSGKPLSPGELAILARVAKTGNPQAQKVYGLLMREGTTKVSGDDSGAWFHKVSPSYWFKSAEEKKLIDAEKEKWIENAKLQKQLGKQQEVLDQAQKAKAAAEAVEAAKKQSEATAAQLKAIEASIKGTLMGSFVGHENPTEISKTIESALSKTGQQKRAAELYAKIVSGQALSPDEVKDAREIAKTLHRVKVVHGDLYQKAPVYLSALHGDFIGACMAADVQLALQRNKICGRAANALGEKIASSQTLSGEDERALASLGRQTALLQKFARAHVSGKAHGILDRSADLKRSIVAGTIKAAMTPAEVKMVAAIHSLAKAGNPRAAEGLRRLRESGAIMGGDHVGLSISETFKYATAPVWLPAKHLYAGAKWTGKKLGIVSKGQASPEQVRLAQMRAAAQRRVAAQARANAADAQTEAELRAQQSIATAADAEADAADAEALSKEAAMRTKEIAADPSQAQDAESEDTSGDFVGGWSEFVGSEKDKKIVAKASEKSATGVKIRSGASLYRKIKSGDPAAKASLKNMIARSQKGDRQATLDLRAVYAGRQAVLAKQKAQQKHAAKLAANARKMKVIAAQRRVEARLANKLARMERRHELVSLSRVERRAAAGHKKSVAYVAKQVDLSKKGDKKAASRVQKLKLARRVRQAAPTARERRNLAVAGKLYSRAAKNDPRALRQIQVIQAAAKQGNPNAKRALKRLHVARDVEVAVSTGAVAAVVAAAAKRDKKSKHTRAQDQATVARARAKLAAGTGSREELAAGARAAQALGDEEAAGTLAMASARAPSATETLKKTSAVVAAKEAGNPEAKAAVSESFEAAKQGDPAEIRKMGDVVAAQTLSDLKQGKPVPQAMRDAVNLQERVAAGDPTAVETARQVAEAATGPNPPAEATAAAITLAAAAVTAKALAAKPRARQEFLDKVNPPLSAPEQAEAEQQLAAYVRKADDGTISAEEGLAAERLAERMGRPRVAAQIAAKSPPPPPATPMSTLPNLPQAPIKGVVGLIKETLRALTFSTRDPVVNWREGVAARAKTPSPTETAGVGWSPFDYFRRHALVLPGVSLATSAASFATMLTKGKGAPAPAPAPAAAAPSPAPAVAQVKATPAESPDKSEGNEDGPHMTQPLRELLAASVEQKRITRQDFGRAVRMYAGPEATDKERAAVGSKLLAFLQKKKVEIVSAPSPTVSGNEPTFKDRVAAALQSKKMSRSDFNKAIAAHLGDGATPDKKLAVGKQVLDFLTARGVKVET